MAMRNLLACLLLSFAVYANGYAATYYVRNGGDDSADGKSPATAWATIGKVNSHSFSAGDSVLFHEGDTWTGATLGIGWSGTSSKQAVIGAYYVDAGQPQTGFRTRRPTIDGQKKYPSSHYAPLVEVKGDNVRVQDLAIVNSQGRGIVFDSVSDDHAVNLVLSSIYDGSIKFLTCSGCLAEGNTVSDSDRVWPEAHKTWSAAISANGSSNVVIRGNNVIHEYGEGINVFGGSKNSIIEHNYLFGVRAVGIYSDGAPSTTIRYNIVVGANDSRFWRNGKASGAGIALNNESYHYAGHGGSQSTSVQSKNAKIYGNLVAYTNDGIAIWGQLDGSSFDNTMIYNNTLVDNDVQFASLDNRPMPNSQFMNNILMSISSGTADVNSSSLSGLVAKNNYFSQGDPGGTFSSSGNVYKGLQLARMSGWRSVTDPASVSWRDFQIAPGGSTIGAGNSTPLKNATANDSYNMDFNGKPHNRPPDMGAIRFGTLKRVPGTPSGLTATSSAGTT